MATPTPQTETVVQEKITKEDSLVQLRKLMEQERKARVEAEDRANRLESERKAFAGRHENDQDEDDDSEPYVDKKKLNKKLSQWEQKLEEKWEQKTKQTVAQAVEMEKRNGYLKENRDFDQVLDDRELLQKFADKHPSLAEGILSMPDTFERARLVYETVKALGVNKKPETPSIQSQIDANKKNPYYYQPQGSGPGYSGNGDFSAAGQKNAYTKMQDLIRNRRAG